MSSLTVVAVVDVEERETRKGGGGEGRRVVEWSVGRRKGGNE